MGIAKGQWQVGFVLHFQSFQGFGDWDPFLFRGDEICVEVRDKLLKDKLPPFVFGER